MYKFDIESAPDDEMIAKRILTWIAQRGGYQYSPGLVGQDIMDHADTLRFALFVLTPRSIEMWPHMQVARTYLRYAIEQRYGFFIPVKIIPCTPPLYMSPLVPIDLTDAKTEEQARSILLEGLPQEGVTRLKPADDVPFPGH